MKIHGFNTLTLLDYPGHIGATLFVGGCNFRCPFCQNAGLVLSPQKEPFIEEEEIFSYLKKRQKLLEGVCITGGEPTLYEKELPRFLDRIKELGYLVKLDTNGTNPRLIRSLHEEGLIDYAAMDIKSSPKNYGKAVGLESPDLTPIFDSVQYLMSSGLEYEFRTTVVRELHSMEDFEAVGEWLKGCRAYYLQAYKDSENVIQRGFSSCSKEELERFREVLKKTIPLVELRGID